MPFGFNKRAGRYYDKSNGRFLSQRTVVSLRDKWTDANKKIVDQLAVDYDNGTLRLSEFITSMRQEVKINYIEQYILGIGGRNNMTPQDWGRVGRAIQDQYSFLRGFGEDLLNKQPPLTLAQIQSRAKQYIDGSTAMFERASAKSKGAPDLPEYPADGKQDCKSNCKCNWDIEDMGNRWECTWVLEEGAKHCETCLENSKKYSPLVIMK